MMEVHSYQTPPSSEARTATTTNKTNPTASPATRTPQGPSSSANRQDQKSQSRIGSSRRTGSNNNNEEEEEEGSWVMVAQEQDEKDKTTISTMSPSQIMARPLRTLNRISASKNNKTENEQQGSEIIEPQQCLQIQEKNEWNWKDARKELSKIKQRLIVKLYPIQKPKQKHYKNFMIQPIPNEPSEFPTEQFADESHLKKFDLQQQEQIPNFDPNSFPSELAQFGSINPQKVPDPDDFILQQLPRLDIPSISPQDIASELGSFGEVNPQIVRDPNDLILQPINESEVPSTEELDLRELKAEIDVLEAQLERRNELLDRLSAKRIAILERTLEKKQRQVASLTRRLMELKTKQQNQRETIASSNVEQEQIGVTTTKAVDSRPNQHVDESVVASNVENVEPEQPQKQQSPTRNIQTEIARLEQRLYQRKNIMDKLQHRLLLLKRIRIRHRLIQKLKSSQASSRQVTA